MLSNSLIYKASSGVCWERDLGEGIVKKERENGDYISLIDNNSLFLHFKTIISYG